MSYTALCIVRRESTESINQRRFFIEEMLCKEAIIVRSGTDGAAEESAKKCSASVALDEERLLISWKHIAVK